MSLLELILIFVLQFEGISGEIIVYKTPGHDVTLSCSSLLPADTKCSDISWLYNIDLSAALNVVQRGKIKKESPQAARLSLKSDCSLVIKNITAEDVGLYTCRLREETYSDMNTSLSVLTISPSPPDADPNRGDEVILKCSLWRHTHFGPCEPNSVCWVDEEGTVLLGEGLEYEFLGQKNCVSYLKLKHLSGNNKRFACQVVNQDKVLIKAEYPPVIDIKEEDQTKNSDSDQTYIIVGAAVGLLVFMLVITAVFIKTRRRTTVTADVEKPNQHPDEPESSLTYVTLSHANQRASPQKKVKVEEDVTYSAVKMTVKTEAQHDVSVIYSTVSKPK